MGSEAQGSPGCTAGLSLVPLSGSQNPGLDEESVLVLPLAQLVQKLKSQEVSPEVVLYSYLGKVRGQSALRQTEPGMVLQVSSRQQYSWTPRGRSQGGRPKGRWVR